MNITDEMVLAAAPKDDPTTTVKMTGPWSISSQGSWYVENTQAHSYTTVGISKNGNVKALAVSIGDNDEGDFIVAALNFYEKHLSQVEGQSDG